MLTTAGGPPPVVIGHAGNGRDALSKAILTAPEHARVDNAWFCSFQSVVHQRRVKSPAALFIRQDTAHGSTSVISWIGAPCP